MLLASGHAPFLFFEKENGIVVGQLCIREVLNLNVLSSSDAPNVLDYFPLKRCQQHRIGRPCWRYPDNVHPSLHAGTGRGVEHHGYCQVYLHTQ